MTALSEREDDVDARLRSFLGSPEPEAAGWTGDMPTDTPLPAMQWSPSPSPPRSRSPTESLSGASEPEDEGEGGFPATQDMGTSSLASEYARPPRSPTQVDTETDTLLPQAPPVLGLTQQVRDDFQKREAAQRRRDAIAASQDADAGEPNDGGWFVPSQRAPLSPSRISPAKKPSSPISTHAPFRAGGGTRGPGCLPRVSGSGEVGGVGAAAAAGGAGARRRAIFAALGN